MTYGAGTIGGAAYGTSILDDGNRVRGTGTATASGWAYRYGSADAVGVGLVDVEGIIKSAWFVAIGGEFHQVDFVYVWLEGAWRQLQRSRVHPLGISAPALAVAVGEGAVAADGVVLPVARATGTGAASATGGIIKLGVAQAVGLGSVAATGVVSAMGSAQSFGVGLAAASGTRATTGGLAATGAGSSAVMGVRTVFGSASVVGVASVASDGTTGFQGHGELTGSGTASSTGVQTAFGSASSQGVGAVTATGVRSTSGSASAAASGATTAAGVRVVSGTASATGAGTTTGAGSIAGSQGGGSVNGVGSVSATGVRVALGSAVTSGSGAVTASGVGSTPGGSVNAGPYDVALVVNSTSHGATTNTKAALEASGHTVTLFVDTAYATNDYTGQDIIVICRGVGTQAQTDDIITEWEAGTPVVFGSGAGLTAGTGRSMSPTYADLTGTWEVVSSTQGNTELDVIDNSNPGITSHLTLGRLSFYTAANWLYGLDSAASFVGTALADGDPDGSTAGQHTLIAIPEGTSRLNGAGPTPTNAVVFGDLYGGQSTYTADGITLLDRCLQWCMGVELLEVPPDPRIASAEADALTVTDHNRVAAVEAQVLVPFAAIPSDLEGLQFWFDADAITGLSDTDPVAQWDDQSGNDRHATQGTAVNQPTYRTGILNGLPVVRFDGGDFLAYFDGALAFSQPNTVFAVAKRTGTGTRQYVFDGGGTIGGRHLLALYNSTNAQMWAGAWLDGGASDTAWHLFRLHFNTTSSTFHRDGISAASGDAGSHVFDDGIHLGAARTAGNPDRLDGDIAELIVYNRTLTAGEITDIENYLSTKYGL